MEREELRNLNLAYRQVEIKKNRGNSESIALLYEENSVLLYG